MADHYTAFSEGAAIVTALLDSDEDTARQLAVEVTSPRDTIVELATALMAFIQKYACTLDSAMPDAQANWPLGQAVWRYFTRTWSEDLIRWDEGDE